MLLKTTFVLIFLNIIFSIFHGMQVPFSVTALCLEYVKESKFNESPNVTANSDTTGSTSKSSAVAE